MDCSGETMEWPPEAISLTPGKRVLFLTKDLDLIRQQIENGLDLRMEDLRVEDLLDDINTDVMTPAWVCFDHDPAKIAENAYAGLKHHGLRSRSRMAWSSMRRRPSGTRTHGGWIRGHRLRTAQGHGVLKGDSRSVRALERYQDRDRAEFRTDSRAQQHQSRPAHG